MTPAPRGRPVRDGAILAVAIVVILAIWCGRSAFGGWWLADRTHTADAYMISTLYERWAGQVTSGHLPLWFPDFAAGHPVHAAWMYGLFSPALLIFTVLPPETAWTWLAILHVAFGALGMYAFLWDERRDTAAAAAGAIVFALSGFCLGRISCGHLNLLMPFAWTPWVLRAALRTVRGVPGAWAWLGVTAALGMLAGHVQIWFYAVPVIAAACVFEMKTRGAWRAWTRLAAGGAAALAISAVQWLPAAELFTVSGHPPEPKSLVVFCSADWTALVGSIAPAWLHPKHDFSHESLGLAGPLAVAGAFLAFKLSDRRRLFWFAVFAVGLVVATGTTNPVGDLANELPPFRFARAPGRALTMVVLAASVLSADLVADWFASAKGWVRAAVPVAFAASALVCGVQPPGSVKSDFQDFDWMQLVPPEARGHRVHVRDMRYPYPERGGAETIRDVCPIDTKGYKLLTWSTPEHATMPASIVAAWLDVGAQITIDWKGPPEGADATQALASAARVRLFDIGDDASQAAPPPQASRARFMSGPAIGSAADEEAFSLLRGRLRACILAPEDAAPSPVSAFAAKSSVRALPRTAPGEIAVDVTSDAPGVVLVSSKWYPGWTRVDDRSEMGRVRRANLALIAVAVGAGETKVRLRYEPSWLVAALGLGAAGLLAAAAGVVVTRRRVSDSAASG